MKLPPTTSGDAAKVKNGTAQPMLAEAQFQMCGAVDIELFHVHCLGLIDLPRGEIVLQL